MKSFTPRTWLMNMVLSLFIVSFVDDVSADDLLGASNEEIIEEFKRTFNHCLMWRLRGREMDSIFPKVEFLSQEEKIQLTKTAFYMIGDQPDPPTSLNYMLNDMALSMYLAGHPPGEIELAVFNFCSKYQAPYTKKGDRGSYPNPKLRDE